MKPIVHIVGRNGYKYHRTIKNNNIIYVIIVYYIILKRKFILN